MQFLGFVADTTAKDEVHGPCMDENDVNTSLELKEFDDNADGDDAVEEHSTHWHVAVPTVDVVNDGNLLDVKIVLAAFPCFLEFEALLDMSNYILLAAVVAAVVSFEYLGI